MKFIPRNNQIVGRKTIKRSDSMIILKDETKVTKYILIDAVGPGAAEKGIKVGDVVVVTRLMNIEHDAGRLHVSFGEEEHVAMFVTDIDIEKDLLVQIPSGKEYVPFDDERAMQSVGADISGRESKAA